MARRLAAPGVGQRARRADGAGCRHGTDQQCRVRRAEGQGTQAEPLPGYRAPRRDLGREITACSTGSSASNRCGRSNKAADTCSPNPGRGLHPRGRMTVPLAAGGRDRHPRIGVRRGSDARFSRALPTQLLFDDVQYLHDVGELRNKPGPDPDANIIDHYAEKKLSRPRHRGSNDIQRACSARAMNRPSTAIIAQPRGERPAGGPCRPRQAAVKDNSDARRSRKTCAARGARANAFHVIAVSSPGGAGTCSAKQSIARQEVWIALSLRSL